MSIKVDLSPMKDALITYQRATNKTPKRVADKAGGNLTIEAHRRTPKTPGSMISQWLNTTFTYWTPTKMADGEVVRIRKHRTKKINQAKRKYLILSARARKKGETLTRQQMGGKVTAFQKARRWSSGYSKVIMAMAGQAFGLFKTMRPAKGWARDSEGKPGDEAPVSTATIKFVGPKRAIAKLEKPIRDAIPAVKKDMTEYALRLLTAEAKKVSAK